MSLLGAIEERFPELALDPGLSHIFRMLEP